jgi:hypothetical protein
MARNLRLIRFDNLGEKTDTNLFLVHQIQQAEPRPIRQRRKKQFHIEGFFFTHSKNIIAYVKYVLTYLMMRDSIFIVKFVFPYMRNKTGIDKDKLGWRQ